MFCLVWCCPFCRAALRLVHTKHGVKGAFCNCGKLFFQIPAIGERPAVLDDRLQPAFVAIRLRAEAEFLSDGFAMADPELPAVDGDETLDADAIDLWAKAREAIGVPVGVRVVSLDDPAELHAEIGAAIGESAPAVPERRRGRKVPR